MIETTRIWEYQSYEAALRKKYGSRRSGTIYIVADGVGEAKQIVRDLYAQAGLDPGKDILVEESHLVKKALRVLY